VGGELLARLGARAAILVNRAAGPGVRPGRARELGLAVLVAPGVSEPTGAGALRSFMDSWEQIQ
jgi:hypothetical protein